MKIYSSRSKIFFSSEEHAEIYVEDIRTINPLSLDFNFYGGELKKLKGLAKLDSLINLGTFTSAHYGVINFNLLNGWRPDNANTGEYYYYVDTSGNGAVDIMAGVMRNPIPLLISF